MSETEKISPAPRWRIKLLRVITRLDLGGSAVDVADMIFFLVPTLPRGIAWPGRSGGRFFHAAHR